MSNTSQNENWVLGVVLGLLGSIAINTGNNIQSLGLKRLGVNASNDSLPNAQKETLSPRKKKHRGWNPFSKDKVKTAPLRNNSCDDFAKTSEQKVISSSPHTSTTWLIGTFIFVSGSLLNFTSYAFAAQSMLASLESIQFVTNLMFGKFMLGANVTRTMLIGTCLTVIGTLMAVQFSSKTTLELKTAEMKQLYANPAYISYLVVMVGLLVSLDFCYRVYERFQLRGQPLRFTGLVMPVAFSVWSALFGTQSVVQAKILAELLAVHSSGEENIFLSWFTYLTLLLWLSTVAVWLKRLNDALSKFNPLFIIPMLQCSFIFFAIISGGIFFKEFNMFTLDQWLGFWCGVCIMFSGLGLLTPKEKKNDDVVAQDVVDLLISSGGLAAINDLNVVRPPSTPAPTPRPSTDLAFQKNTNDEYDMINITPRCINSALECASDDEKNKNLRGKIVTNLLSSPRDFRSVAVDAAVETMKGVVKESSNLFNSSHYCTEVLTNAMLSATEEKQRERKKRECYLRLQKLLIEHSSSGGGDFSAEILELIHELNLDSTVADSNNRKQSPEKHLSRRILWELEKDAENDTEV
mmetsp:Transcript_37540/g.54971  ORF Transcript_37540/g.54971 Transcript_37540/m.54971 type:complete len:578 (-) Transcript_37540:1716-3449(-)